MPPISSFVQRDLNDFADKRDRKTFVRACQGRTQEEILQWIVRLIFALLYHQIIYYSYYLQIYLQVARVKCLKLHRGKSYDESI